MSIISFDSKKAMHYEEYARKAVFGYDQLFIMVLSLLVENHIKITDISLLAIDTIKDATSLSNDSMNLMIYRIKLLIDIVNF